MGAENCDYNMKYNQAHHVKIVKKMEVTVHNIK